ncbi:MAG TPA: helix-turn-helix transcriptional regulator [Allosphingosinicella sp.]|jgi:hypothetical protein
MEAPVAVRDITNPLKAWRETQRRLHHRTREPEVLGITEAAKAIGVPYQTWRKWEMGDAIPDRDNMKKLFLYTRGQVRPDHFYGLAELRGAIGAAERAGLIPPRGVLSARDRGGGA